MSLFKSPRFAILLALSALLAASPAKAAATLAEAIKEADAKYLDAKEVETTGDEPRIEAGSGEEETPSTDREIAKGNIKATLTYKESKTESGEGAKVPIVTVFADDKQVAQLEGEESGLSDPPVSVQIAEIDPANSNTEVVVSFYTGGAHCCSDTKLVTSGKDGSSWKTVEVGEFDGSPLLASDLVGDRTYVFATRDNAFLYTFACYACSTAPLKILAIENGEVKNVSGDPRFRPAHEAYLKSIITEVPDEDLNGFLAGYVGEKILLGEGKKAWKLMLAYYDRKSDWGSTFATSRSMPKAPASGKTERLTYPEALERMLNENGYKVEK